MPSSNSASSSSTSQTTTAINPVVVAENGSMAFSNVANGGDIYQQVNNTTLDKDVAIRAMDNTLTATQDALLFGNDAMRQSYAFVGDQTAQTYAFAGQQTQQAYSFADAANQASKATSVAAISSASSSMDKALAFGAKQTSVALDSLSQSADRIDTAYKDAKGVLSTNVILVAIAAGVVIVYFAMGRKN